MKLNNKVDRIGMSINNSTGEFEDVLVVKFDVDFEFSNDESIDKKSFFVSFDKDGKIENFPDIKFNSKDPMRYIALGNVVKEIMSYEGDRARNMYNKAIDIAEEYELQKKDFINVSNYEDLHKKRLELISIINESTTTFKRVRNLDKKSILEKELIKLQEDLRNLCDEQITPIEQRLNMIEFEKRKAISDLIM